MFGEYAQLASYINQDVFEGNQVNDRLSYLPSYLLPMFDATNPFNNNHGTSQLGTQDDFIIIAEFSEIEGPKPLMTIPRDGGHGFDKNAFSVKIMAVDHQTSTTGFSVSEDTQVIITDCGDLKVSSFVHHFALYDIQARGFVRPFCMAYVTKEEKKLINFYEELSLQFKKVAKFFKYGNKMVFVKDLEQHSKDLEYTKSCLVVKFNKSSSDEPSSDETKYKDLQNIQTSLEEIRDLLVILRPLLNDKRLENRFCTLETRAWRECNKPHKSTVDSISLQEHWFSEHGDTPTTKYGSLNEANENPLYLFDKKQSYTPKIVETKRKKKFDRTLRGLHELCSWGAKEGMKKLRCIYEHFKREAMILELEIEEDCLLDPSSSILSCGQCVTHNFLSGLSLRPTDCPYSALGSKPIDLSQRWSSLDTLEGSIESFKSVVSDESLKSAHSSDSFVMASERFYDEDTVFSSNVQRTDSNISISSSQTDTDTMASVYESFPSSPVKTPDKTIIPQEEFTSFHQSTTNQNISETDSDQTLTSASQDNQDNNQETVDLSSVERDCSIVSDSAEKEVDIVGLCTSMLNVRSGKLESDNKINDNCCDDVVHIDSDIPVENIIEEYVGLSRQFSEPDDNTDTTQSSSEGAKLTGNLFRKPRGGIYTVGDLLFNLRPGSPGIGIIQVLSKYNNLHHIINSLLTGRIVLVIGNMKHETEVMTLVTALSLFVPNHRRKHHSIIEWSSKPLRVTDLSRIKLAGVCRSEKRSVESAVKKYCSVIDVEKKLIIAPTYQGTIIYNITCKKKNFKTDGDLIAFTHCWLMEIASKAFIFYHSFCLGSTNIINHNSSLAAHKQQYCNSVKRFLAKLGVHEGDSSIIEYLTEVIKLLQLDQNTQPINDGCMVSPVLLSYQTCQLFRC